MVLGGYLIPQEKLETIEVLHSEIIELIDDEDAVTTEIEQNNAYRETIHSSLLKIKKAQGKIVAPPTATATTPSTPVIMPATSTQTEIETIRWRINTVDKFCESFEAAVHANPS